MVSSATRRADGLIDSPPGVCQNLTFFLTQPRMEAKMKRHNLIETYE